VKNHVRKISDIKDIPLANIVVDRKRSSDCHRRINIDELALVIKKYRLLQPIVVCLADEPSKYKVLSGLHYYLAYKKLHKKTITALICDAKVSKKETDEISLLESSPTKL
jgi:ParB-like chromosome segregation protein Spo0J